MNIPREGIEFKNDDGTLMVFARSHRLTDNGNPLNGRWAIYEAESGIIHDFDQYRNDLHARWKDKIAAWNRPIKK